MFDTFSNNSLYNKDLLNRTSRPQTRAHYFTEWDGFSMRFHSHDAVEIMYVISGTCLVETRDASLAMGKGEFILLDAMVEHRLQVGKDKPCRMLNIEFGFAEEEGCLPSLGDIVQECAQLKNLLLSEKPYIIMQDSEDIYVTLKSLILELDRNNGAGSLLVGLLYDQLLIRLSRLYSEQQSKEAGPELVHVKKAIRFMHQFYHRDISIKDIASAASVHPGYLHRIFKGSRGCTINDYLTRLRIEKAKSLLANTDIQITDIPGYVGVNSRQYFAFVFKKHAGCSPSSYRKTVGTHKSRYY